MRRIQNATFPAAVVAMSVILAGLISAPPADAGQFHVYACHTPDGGD
jgi:hypothetical protein